MSKKLIEIKNIPDLNSLKQIGFGAEAKVYLDEKNERIFKIRESKKYRIALIDKKLTKKRTKTESNILMKSDKCQNIFPKFIGTNNQNIIEMEYIKGQQVKEILDKNIDLSKEIGKNLAIIHNENIIHSDLTTSNMILSKNNIKFIDFGIGYVSTKIEDKAVDLHLFRQAVESKHYKHTRKIFDLFLEGYKSQINNYDEIYKRYKIVQSRGRNKH
jgi:Kae1-associated kinase Bud32